MRHPAEIWKLLQAVGHRIHFVDVVEKGYEIRFSDCEDTALIEASSYYFGTKIWGD